MLVFWGGQVVRETFIKQDVANSSSDLVTYNNCIITVYFWSRYTSASTNLFRLFDFKVGLSGIC